MAKSVLHRLSDGTFEITYTVPHCQQVTIPLATRDEAEALRIQRTNNELLSLCERAVELEKVMDADSYSDLLESLSETLRGVRGNWLNPYEA